MITRPELFLLVKLHDDDFDLNLLCESSLSVSPGVQRGLSRRSGFVESRIQHILTERAKLNDVHRFEYRNGRCSSDTN